MNDLNEILKYNNQAVINRFLKTFNFTQLDAKTIFSECLKWLWLCAKINIDRKADEENLPNNLLLDSDTIVIDEMWHCFILFTKDYYLFCESNFGFFIHHFPVKKNEKLTYNLEDNYKLQYEYIYDNLGEDTLEKWYVDFPAKYSPNILNSKYCYERR